MGKLPPVLDFEWSGESILSNAFNILWDYLEELERLTVKVPIIYSGSPLWNQYGSKATSWSKYPLWIASYTSQSYMESKLPKPWTNWSFWQWTSKGDGLKYGVESLDLDLNYCTRKTLKRLTGKGEIPVVDYSVSEKLNNL